jgi:beta-lactamase class A
MQRKVNNHVNRHAFLIASISTLTLAPYDVAWAQAKPEAAIAALERRAGGRLGVFAVDTSDDRYIAHRAHERFAMCSTFKLLAVSAVLARVDRGTEYLNRRIHFGERDLLDYAPVTRTHVHEGSMTVEALCAATIELSDNTAANLLLASLGGPVGVTRYARSLGDTSTLLDRNEPTLNTAIPGDSRDTTTPAAMARNVRTLLLGNALTAHSRETLSSLLAACQTGATCIRAGIPATWKAGDKTGSGDNGTRNDVAILYPGHRAPIIVAAYLTGSHLSRDAQNEVLAAVGKIVSHTFA